MVLKNSVHEIRTRGEIAGLEKLKAVDNMIFKNVELFLGQNALLLEQVLRDHLLADVEEESGQDHVLPIDSGESHHFAMSPPRMARWTQ